jgi:hypothetical protein
MQMNLFNPPSHYHYLSRTANIYEQEWNEAMWKLANSRHQLTVEDENAIKKIANKL